MLLLRLCNISFFLLQLWGCLCNFWGQWNVGNTDISKVLKKVCTLKFCMFCCSSKPLPHVKKPTPDKRMMKNHMEKKLAFPAEALLNQPHPSQHYTQFKCEPSKVQPVLPRHRQSLSLSNYIRVFYLKCIYYLIDVLTSLEYFSQPKLFWGVRRIFF